MRKHSVLYAMPKSIFSWGFEVCWENDLLATIDMAWLTEGGSFQHEGNTYSLRKERMLSGNFRLESNGDIIAQAKKTALIRSFEIQCSDKMYKLSAISPFTRSFVLKQNGDTVGNIAPNHPFTRKCIINLPEEISIPVRLFMFWLVLLMWRRTTHSTAATS